MRRSMMIPAVIAVVFAGAAVPAMTQEQLPVTLDATQQAVNTPAPKSES